MPKKNEPNFVDELKRKQSEGKLKPSEFKTKSSANDNPIEPELAKEQAELKTLKENFANFTQILTEIFPEEQLPPNQLLTKLIEERNALELALFEKRLENLKQFSHYQERINELVNTEVTELNALKKQNEQLAQRINKLKNSLPPYHTPSIDKKWMWFLGMILVLSLIVQIVK